MHTTDMGGGTESDLSRSQSVESLSDDIELPNGDELPPYDELDDYDGPLDRMNSEVSDAAQEIPAAALDDADAAAPVRPAQNRLLGDFSGFQSGRQHKRGTLNWFKDRLGEEAWAGAGQTLQQWLYTRLCQKVTHNLTDQAFEEQLTIEYQEKVIFEKRALALPTTMHMMRGLVGVKDLSEVEFHICPCESHCWPPMRKADYPAPLDAEDNPMHCCPKCGTDRFMVVTRPNQRADVVPRQVTRQAAAILQRHFAHMHTAQMGRICAFPPPLSFRLSLSDSLPSLSPSCSDAII